jgi:hypothetical protein
MFSMLTPTQQDNGNAEIHAPRRFVSTMYWCQFASSMTLPIASRHSVSTVSCPKSDMLHTNTLLGFFTFAS